MESKMIRFRLHTNEWMWMWMRTYDSSALHFSASASIHLNWKQHASPSSSLIISQIKLFIYIIRFLCWMAERTVDVSVSVVYAIVVSIWPFCVAQQEQPKWHVYSIQRTNQPASETAFVMDTPTVITLSSALNTIWPFANPFEHKSNGQARPCHARPTKHKKTNEKRKNL